MIPHTYPTFNDARGAAYMEVFFLPSVTGLTRWVDYIPVKTVAFSVANEGTTNAGGHMTVVQVASSTALQRWVDYIPVFEDAAATVPWDSGSSGYIPVCQALMLDFMLPVLDSRITFTRADATSCATYFGNDGLLKTAAANVARFDYDPATLRPLGLLIEEQRTNLLLHSRDMTQAAWSKTDVTPTRNQVGIDGTANSACLMTEGSATTASISQAASFAAGSTVTFSKVFKRGNTDWVCYENTETAPAAAWTNIVRAWFNLGTGAKGSVTTAGATTGASSTITNLGGGFYRCTVTATFSGTATTASESWHSASADSSTTRVNGATYIVDCAQLEVGSFATSIITTGAATVTRAADSASMTGTNFSSWFNASAGTFVVEADSIANNAATAGVLGVSDGTASNFLGIRVNAGGLATAGTAISGGVNQTTINAGVITFGSVFKAAHAYLVGTDRSYSQNGATAATQAGYTAMTAPNAFSVGYSQGGNLLNGHVRRLTYYPTRLANATLQALTL